MIRFHVLSGRFITEKTYTLYKTEYYFRLVLNIHVYTSVEKVFTLAGPVVKIVGKVGFTNGKKVKRSFQKLLISAENDVRVWPA